MPEIVIAPTSDIESSVVIADENNPLLPGEDLEDYFARKEQERNVDAERARMEQEEKLALEREDIRLIENLDPSTKVRVEKVVVKDTKTYERASSSAPSKHEKGGAVTESKPPRLVDGKIIDADGSSVLQKMLEKGNVPPEGLARAQKREQELATQGYSITETFRSFNGDGKMWRTVYRVNDAGEITYENYQVSLVKTPAVESKSGAGEFPAVIPDSPRSEEDANAEVAEPLSIEPSDNRVYNFFDSLVSRGEIVISDTKESVAEVSEDARVATEEVSERVVIAPVDDVATSLEKTEVSVPEEVAIADETVVDVSSGEEHSALEEVALPIEAQQSVEAPVAPQIESSVTAEPVVVADVAPRVAVAENIVITPEEPVAVGSASPTPSEPVSIFEPRTVAPEVSREEVVAEQVVAQPSVTVVSTYETSVEPHQDSEIQNVPEELVVKEHEQHESLHESPEVVREQESVVPVRQQENEVVADSVTRTEKTERVVSSPVAERAEKKVDAPPVESAEKKSAEPVAPVRSENAPDRPSFELRKSPGVEVAPRTPEKHGIRLVRLERTDSPRTERPTPLSTKEVPVAQARSESFPPTENRFAPSASRPAEFTDTRSSVQPRVSLQQDLPTASLETPSAAARPPLTLNGVTLRRAA